MISSFLTTGDTPMKHFLIALTLGTLIAGGAAAAESKPALQFKDIGDVKDWRADGPITVYVKDQANQWYKVTMIEGCMTLNTKSGVKFMTEIDPTTSAKVSKVVVDRHIC